MEITISTQKLIRVLAVVVILLTLVNLAGQISRYYLGHGRLFGLVDIFDTDREGNVPAWYSSATLLVCSILLALIASARKANGVSLWHYWLGLSVIFLFLSLDEGASIHEVAILPLREYLHAGSYLYFTWVVLGIGFVVVFLLTYFRFIVDLPPPTRGQFLVAGTFYLSGTIGMELLGGDYAFRHSTENMTYVLITTIEEFLEMVGILLFIYALMTYIGSRHVEFRFRITE